MIKTIYTDCSLSEEDLLHKLNSNEEVKSILKQLESDEKDYTICLDLSENGIDHSCMMWVTKNEEGKYTVVEGSKVFNNKKEKNTNVD